MVWFSPLHLCVWHFIRLSIYPTFQQSETKVPSEPEWVPEITATINRRLKLPFHLISAMLVYSCLVTTISSLFAVFGTASWLFILSFFAPTKNKTRRRLDTTICCCSFLLYWWSVRDWNRGDQPTMNIDAFQVLWISSIMLCGVFLVNLCMDLTEFSRLALADGLVRVSHYFTLVFQVRINYVVYVLLFLQPMSAICCHLFGSTPFVALSFGMLFMTCVGLATIWNELMVEFCHYSKVRMVIPGTQHPVPASFDYILSYRVLTFFHSILFIALVITVITI